MWGKRKIEKEENIWRKKECFFGGEEKQKRERRKIFGEGKRIFCEENENGEGKVDIYFKRKKYFCGGEEKNRERKGGKYLEKEIFWEEKENEGNIWRG